MRRVENASHHEFEQLNAGKQETWEEKADVAQPSATGNVESMENAEYTETKVEDDIKVKLEGMDNHLIITWIITLITRILLITLILSAK